MFFADKPTTSEDEEIQSSSNVNVQIMSGNDESMTNAAKFMVESFWLGSPQQLLIDSNIGRTIRVQTYTGSGILGTQRA